MADAIRLEVYGLRSLLGRFAQHSARGLEERQDALLTEIARELQSALKEESPRGRGAGPHLADMFRTSSLERQGASATISVSNAKAVHTKAGQSYSLLRLLMPPGTRPHDIPGAFGYPLPFGIGGRFSGHFHPGYRGTPFVAKALRQVNPQERLMRTARGVIGDLSGHGV